MTSPSIIIVYIITQMHMYVSLVLRSSESLVLYRCICLGLTSDSIELGIIPGEDMFSLSHVIDCL